MDIRLLTQSDIPQAKALWKEAFGDSDAFIDWYFANKITPGNSPAMFDENGVLASIVHMIPLRISLQGAPVQSCFIAGAATAESRRGQGLMKTMLLESLRLMRERGIAITHLHPFKHSFYERFGWTTYSYVRRFSVKTAAAFGEVVETDDADLLAPLYDGMMKSFDGYVIRGPREWRWRLEELFADGGKAALLLKNGEPSAYMLYGGLDGEAHAIETVYSGEQDIQSLLAHVLKTHNGVKYFTPAQSAPDSPYGMARIVDAEAFLKLYGAKDVLGRIRITDTFAPWNNAGEGEDAISADELARAAHMGAQACFEDGGAILRHTILKKVFLYRGTCIFEQY